MARRWRPSTLAGTLALALTAARRRRIAASTISIEDRYQHDPVLFAIEVLGIEPTEKQKAILMALVDEDSRVTCRSSHKAGKTTVGAIAALWFFCTRENARVICMATTIDQAQDTIYREVKRLVYNALQPIPGELNVDVRRGLRHQLREIIGIAANTPESVVGYSGANILYIIDEASGIPTEILEALDGNSAGMVRWLMIGNPTHSKGYFYDSHRSKSHLWTTFALSALDSPNITGEADIPGLATKAWMERMLASYGPKSPIYLVRVLGEFAESAADRIIPADLWVRAHENWEETRAVGPIVIGLDPAGPGVQGDESAFAVRVGNKVVTVTGYRGLTDDAHAVTAVRLIAETRKNNPGATSETPIVVIDSEGAVGAKVYASMLLHARLHPGDFKVIRVRSSEKAKQHKFYYRVCDELWSNLYDWLARGDADGPLVLPMDTLLEQDLAAQSWIYDRDAAKQKITPKDKIRQILKRSPDRADAVCLCVWSRAAKSQIAQARSSGSSGPRERKMPSPYGGLGY